ncbi:IucA/IucC family protein [Lysobacter sp. GCM10012299]|uniref:IucA/IucC family protein n=1 Tax=Lysobacter sp. GCM10012299 TaxID=3317333 RepID=UPI003611B4C1
MDMPSICREPASLSAFMNSLAREWSHAQWLEPGTLTLKSHEALALPAGALRLPMTQPAGALVVPVRHRSAAGRHRFTGAVWFAPRDGEAFEIDFAQAASMLAAEPTLRPGATLDQRRVFLRRVLDSAGTVLRAQAQRRDDLLRLAWPDADYLDAEQALVHGHAVHPTPKSRDEFSDEDLARYSPELAGRTPLCWFALRDRALWRTDVGVECADGQIAMLVAADPAVATALAGFRREDGWFCLPVHPWQARALRSTPAYAHWLRQGDLVDLGELGLPWFPTSSLRTMYAPHAPSMLKFSLSVRLTNSRRVLQPAEVARGRQIHDAFASAQGQALQLECPTLRILHETAALALADVDGQPVPESFVILRDNPFVPGNHAYVLATFCQDGIDGMPSMASRLITELARRRGRDRGAVAIDWFERFVQTVVRPFLLAHGNHGFLFSAHAQNTVVAIEAGWPAGVWFRDCQGTTFHAETIAALSASVPGIDAASGLSFDEAMTERLLGYYLIVNNVFSLVATLGADGVIDEAILLSRLRDALLELRAGPLRHPHFIDYLLSSPVLWSKGNFMICFGDVDETTRPEASFGSYVAMANPLLAVAA